MEGRGNQTEKQQKETQKGEKVFQMQMFHKPRKPGNGIKHLTLLSEVKPQSKLNQKQGIPYPLDFSFPFFLPLSLSLSISLHAFQIN